MHTSPCMSPSTCMHAQTHTRKHVRAHAHARTYAHAYTHSHLHMHSHMHAFSHVHTHTRTNPQLLEWRGATRARVTSQRRRARGSNRLQQPPPSSPLNVLGPSEEAAEDGLLSQRLHRLLIAIKGGKIKFPSVEGDDKQQSSESSAGGISVRVAAEIWKFIVSSLSSPTSSSTSIKSSTSSSTLSSDWPVFVLFGSVRWC